MKAKTVGLTLFVVLALFLVGTIHSNDSYAATQESITTVDSEGAVVPQNANMTSSKIEGVLIDGETKKPIADFQLYILPNKSKEKPGTKRNHQMDATTDSQGKFLFANLPEGEYSIADSKLNLIRNNDGKYLRFPLDGTNNVSLGYILYNKTK